VPFAPLFILPPFDDICLNVPNISEVKPDSSLAIQRAIVFIPL
jgi:hypothetical protein